MTTTTTVYAECTKQFRLFEGKAQRGLTGDKYKIIPISQAEATRLYECGELVFWSENEKDTIPDGWKCSFIWGTKKSDTSIITDPFDGSKTVIKAEPFGKETAGAIRYWKAIGR